MRPIAATDWERCRSAFTRDGFLRDLYVQDANGADWARCLAWLRASRWPLEYSYQGETAPLPESPISLFEKWGHKISVDADGIIFNSYFFSPDEIEFDIEPGELTSEARFGSLLSFLSGCGRAVGRVAIVTPEGMPQAVILRYLPDSDEIEYVPAA